MSLVFIISWLQPFPDSSSARHCIWFLFFTALSMNFDSFLRILSSDWSFFGYCSSNLSSNSATTLVNTTGTDFPLFTGPIKSIFWNNTLRFSHPRIFLGFSLRIPSSGFLFLRSLIGISVPGPLQIPILQSFFGILFIGFLLLIFLFGSSSNLPLKITVRLITWTSIIDIPKNELISFSFWTPSACNLDLLDHLDSWLSVR